MAKRDLSQAGHTGLVVWALSDNEPAVNFYRSLGGTRSRTFDRTLRLEGAR